MAAGRPRRRCRRARRRRRSAAPAAAPRAPGTHRSRRCPGSSPAQERRVVGGASLVRAAGDGVGLTQQIQVDIGPRDVEAGVDPRLEERASVAGSRPAPRHPARCGRGASSVARRRACRDRGRGRRPPRPPRTSDRTCPSTGRRDRRARPPRRSGPHSPRRRPRTALADPGRPVAGVALVRAVGSSVRPLQHGEVHVGHREVVDGEVVALEQVLDGGGVGDRAGRPARADAAAAGLDPQRAARPGSRPDPR